MWDWIGAVSLVVGTLLLTRKIRFGWVLQAVGSGIYLCVFWNRWALIFLQTVFIVLDIKGWIQWRKPPIKQPAHW